MPCRSNSANVAARPSASSCPRSSSSARRLPRCVSVSCVAAKCSSAAAAADRAIGPPQLHLGHRRAGQVLQHALVAAGPLAGLVVDRAQRAEPLAARGRERHPEVGDDPEVLDRRVVADLRVHARVDDFQRRPGLDDVAAERVRERRRAHVADADRALEHLAVVGDQREQRDGDVQHLGHEPRDAVERGLGGALQQAGLGQRREPPRVPDAVVTAAPPGRSTPRAPRCPPGTRTRSPRARPRRTRRRPR